MDAELAGVWVNAISGIGSIGAFGVAITVFLNANNIKKVEQLALHYRMWADFHQIEIDSGFLDQWGEFYRLQFDENKFSGREYVVTYAILNLLRVSWTMCQEKVLHNSAQQEEVFNYFFALKGKREYLLECIVKGGYDPSFYILFSELTILGRNEASKIFQKSLKRNWARTIKKTRFFEINKAYNRAID
jgi:hypothetical protein